MWKLGHLLKTNSSIGTNTSEFQTKSERESEGEIHCIRYEPYIEYFYKGLYLLKPVEYEPIQYIQLQVLFKLGLGRYQKCVHREVTNSKSSQFWDSGF